jgi:hypothetical protein
VGQYSCDCSRFTRKHEIADLIEELGYEPGPDEA